MDRKIMHARTKAYALEVIRLVETFPRTWTAEILGKQLLRSATPVGANYRSSGRARSKPDFISKLGIIEEEADESLFWMELLDESGIIAHARLSPLMREADEIVAIVVAAIKQARSSLRTPESEESVHVLRFGHSHIPHQTSHMKCLPLIGQTE